MKLGDVLKKERENKKIAAEKMAAQLGISVEEYQELEGGESAIEVWGPKLGQIAIKLSTPTSRLISETGKSAQANREAGQCGRLIKAHREKKALGQKDLADQLELSTEEVILIEEGKTPLETYAPLLLRFSEEINQPIFNLFYPCGVPLDKLQDYP